jgi:CRP-like cAMP-binding protein
MVADWQGADPMGETSARSDTGPKGLAAAAEKPADRLLSYPTAPRRHDNRVLAGLPPADLALLTRHLHVVTLQPGAVLQHQDHPLDYVFFPHEGLVSLLATTPDGGTIEAASVGRGGAICPLHESELHDGFLAAVAQASMRVSRIAATQLQTAQAECEALDRALRLCREALLLQLRQNLVCGGLHAVEQRLSRWLLEAADRLESDVMPITATQEHVAQRLGVRRTTVTLLASRLQETGAIRWGRARVEILDRKRLESTACSCYAALRERVSSLGPADQAVLGRGG